MEQEGKSRYACIAHGCRMYATTDNVCWYHDCSSPQEWGQVTAGMHNHESHLRYISLLLSSDGRQRIEMKHGSLEEAARKAAESLNDADLMPAESDYIKSWTNRDGTVSECRKFDWYAYGTMLRRHLLAVFKKKKELRYWYQEAA